LRPFHFTLHFLSMNVSFRSASSSTSSLSHRIHAFSLSNFQPPPSLSPSPSPSLSQQTPISSSNHFPRMFFPLPLRLRHSPGTLSIYLSLRFRNSIVWIVWFNSFVYRSIPSMQLHPLIIQQYECGATRNVVPTRAFDDVRFRFSKNQFYFIPVVLLWFYSYNT